jgi:hypothetical protein
MSKKDGRSTSLKPGAGMDSFWVMVNLSRPRYWEISRNGVVKKDLAPSAEEGPVLSFDGDNDFRVELPSGRATAAARYFLQENLTKTRVFSQNKKVWYGTPVDRLDEFDHPLYSGTYFLDRLLDKVGRPEDGRVVGFRFHTGDDDSFTIVVMYALLPSGELTPLQLSLNPPDLDLTLREFADLHKVTDADPLLFSVSDVLGLTVGQPYPSEDMIFGIPQRTLNNGVAAVIGAAAIASFAFSGYQYVQTGAIKQQTVEVNKEVKKVHLSTATLLADNIYRYAVLSSINVGKTIGYAEALWSPDVAIDSLSADRTGGKIVARVAIQHVTPAANGSAAVELNDYAAIQNNVERKFDTGLTRGKTSLKQDSHAYEVEYSFQTMDMAGTPAASRK